MMTTSTIRVSLRTQTIVRQMAKQSGISMQDVLEQAIDLYRRKHLLETANLAYASARSQMALQQEIAEEQQAWDATLADGLQEE
jgi:hypothetical protein